MPLSTDIYQGAGQQSLAGGLAGALNQFTEQRARLSDLARQREQQDITQGYQNRALQRAEEAIPAQQAALKQEQLRKQAAQLQAFTIGQVRRGASGDELTNNVYTYADTIGVPRDKALQGISPLLSGKIDAETYANELEAELYPEVFAKQRAEAQFRKPQAQSALANLMAEREQIASVNPQDPRLQIYNQMIEKTTTQAPQMQIVTSEGGGMQAVTLPKIQGQRATVQSLGIQAAPKAGTAAKPQKQDIIKDATESNALLSQAEKIGELATGSGLGQARDVASGFLGISTEGAKAAAQLKVLGASLTAKVPKMGGATSDADLAMYKEAAGNIANEKTPWPIKLAAIQTIREINNRQLGFAQEGEKPPAQSYEGDKEARYQAWKARQGK